MLLAKPQHFDYVHRTWISTPHWMKEKALPGEGEAEGHQIDEEDPLSDLVPLIRSIRQEGPRCGARVAAE